MRVAIRMTKKQELKALPILLRHSPGTMLPDHIYILTEEAVRALREAGITFTEVSRESDTPGLEGVGTGERI